MSTSLPRVFVVIGCGEVARSQHIPLIRDLDDAILGAIVDVDPNVRAPSGVPVFATLKEAVEGSRGGGPAQPTPTVAIVATPPSFAQPYIREALEAGLSVMAEKPPGTDHEALSDLASLASERGLTLFTAYHSTECPAMDLARRWVRENGPVGEVEIEWKEDVAKWHEGQDWVTGGFGVLDIVINPLSIVVELLGSDAADARVVEGSSELSVPENWEGPIAGRTELECADGRCRVSVDCDWSHQGNDIWTIRFRGAREGSEMEIRDGGAQMYIDGKRITEEPTCENKIRPEYEKLYKKFVRLLDSRESDVNAVPLRIINDILSVSKIKRVDKYLLRYLIPF